MSGIINLSKGETINLSKMPSIDLSKGGRGLSKVMVGLGWDPAEEKKGFFGKVLSGSSDSAIDCDAFAMVMNGNKMKSSKGLIYYGNKGHQLDSIYHTGDNLTGDGDGDDETIMIDLSKIDCDRIVIGVNIYKGKERNQHFGKLKNAFIRIVDRTTNTELCHYQLDDKYNGYVSVLFGELVKNNNEWTFVAKGEAVSANSIGEVASAYGY